MSEENPRIGLIVGSLRASSWNRVLRDVAVSQMSARAVPVDVTIDDLPHYNDDLDGAGAPHSVRAFRSTLSGIDALMVFTPTYNLGVPGALKNALDWASRPVLEGPLVGTPALVTGGTAGRHAPAAGIVATNDALVACIAEVMLPHEAGFCRLRHAREDPAMWSEQVVVPLAILVERLLARLGSARAAEV